MRHEPEGDMSVRGRALAGAEVSPDMVNSTRPVRGPTGRCGRKKHIVLDKECPRSRRRVGRAVRIVRSQTPKPGRDCSQKTRAWRK